MEETEDDIESNLLLLSTKKRKTKSWKNNGISKKFKRITKDKYKIDNIQKIFDQGISSNNAIKMIFTLDNSMKQLPILLNNLNNNNNNNNDNNKDEFLIINEEMKINKNVLENNLYNLLKKFI